MPATSLRLHPADAIFVRMGARDHIMAGQSTFYVELAETAAMLHKATPRCVGCVCGREVWEGQRAVETMTWV